MYEEIGGPEFEIITVAQDMLGEEATAEWHDQTELTYTTLIDTTHRVTSLYNLVNVPAGIWVDEEGRIRRINHGTFTPAYPDPTYNSSEYVDAVSDWVANGEDSEYVWSDEEIRANLRAPSSDEALAEPTFKLGVYFYERGDEPRARGYWERAQALAPDNWNYHRQDWNLTEGLAGERFIEKFQSLDGQPYYEPLDLPSR